jgi:hypothetical protein
LPRNGAAEDIELSGSVLVIFISVEILKKIRADCAAAASRLMNGSHDDAPVRGDNPLG